MCKAIKITENLEKLEEFAKKERSKSRSRADNKKSVTAVPQIKKKEYDLNMFSLEDSNTKNTSQRQLIFNISKHKQIDEYSNF